MGPLSLALVVLAVLGGTWSTPFSVLYPPSKPATPVCNQDCHCGPATPAEPEPPAPPACNQDCHCCPYKAMEAWLIRTITAECSCEYRCECTKVCYQEIIDTYGCECRDCCDVDYVYFRKLTHGTECGCSSVDIQAVFHYLCYVDEDVVDSKCYDCSQLCLCGCGDSEYEDLLKIIKCFGISISEEECRKYFEVQCEYDHVSLERCDCGFDMYEDMVMDIPTLITELGYCKDDREDDYWLLCRAMKKYVACHPEDYTCLRELVQITKEIQRIECSEYAITDVLSTIVVDDVLAEDFMCYYVWVLNTNPDLCCYKEEEMKKFCAWKYEVINALECKTCVSAPAFIDWAQRMGDVIECRTKQCFSLMFVLECAKRELDCLDESDRCAFCCWQDEFEKRIQCEEFYCEFWKWCEQMDCEYRQKYGKGLCELWPYINALCDEAQCQCGGYCSGFTYFDDVMYCDLADKCRVDCESYVRQMRILCEELKNKKECQLRDFYHYEYMLRTGFINDSRDDICSYKTLTCTLFQDTRIKLKTLVEEYKYRREIKAAELKCKIAEMLYEWMLCCKHQEGRCHCETEELYYNYICRKEEVTKKALHEMMQVYNCMVASQTKLREEFQCQLYRKQECCCHGKKELAATLKCELQQTFINYDVWKQCAGGHLREIMKKTLIECMMYKESLAKDLIADTYWNLECYLEWKDYMICELASNLCGIYEKHLTWTKKVEQKLIMSLMQELDDYLRIKQEVRVKCEQKEAQFQQTCEWARRMGETLRCRTNDDGAGCWFLCKCFSDMKHSMCKPDFDFYCWQAELEEMCTCSCPDSLKEYYDWKEELERRLRCQAGMTLDEFWKVLECHAEKMQCTDEGELCCFWLMMEYLDSYCIDCPFYDIKGIGNCCGRQCNCIETTYVTTECEC